MRPKSCAHLAVEIETEKTAFVTWEIFHFWLLYIWIGVVTLICKGKTAHTLNISRKGYELQSYAKTRTKQLLLCKTNATVILSLAVPTWGLKLLSMRNMWQNIEIKSNLWSVDVPLLITKLSVTKIWRVYVVMIWRNIHTDIIDFAHEQIECIKEHPTMYYFGILSDTLSLIASKSLTKSLTKVNKHWLDQVFLASQI